MKEMILHWIFWYIRTSISVGIVFVILTSVRKTIDYDNWKERFFIGLIMAGTWPWIVIKYGIFDTIRDFIKKGGAKNDK